MTKAETKIKFAVTLNFDCQINQRSQKINLVLDTILYLWKFRLNQLFAIFIFKSDDYLDHSNYNIYVSIYFF